MFTTGPTFNEPDESFENRGKTFSAPLAPDYFAFSFFFFFYSQGDVIRCFIVETDQP